MQLLKYTIITVMCFCGGCLSADAATRQKAKTSIDTRHPLVEKSENHQTITETKFRELFHQYICESLDKDPDDIVLSRLKINGNRPVDTGELEFQIFQKSKGTLMGYVRLTVIVIVDGISSSEVGLSAWVDVFGPVVCAARTLDKGETIRTKDVYLARKNISRMPANTLTDKGMAIGLAAKNTLNENTCLKEYMLKRMPTLEKGDMVTILAEVGGLKVTTPGRTLERGFAGDLIRVQNTMSKKNIYASIVDDSTVEVHF
jgi:flagella basal body P-ring formation protein FlgA